MAWKISNTTVRPTTGLASDMLVVADTTPLNYLILINHIDILAPLYGQVIIFQTEREHAK
jgi:hypothetical protein